MKRLQLRFGRGREVLDAYWGFLAGGGIVIDDSADLAVGQRVAVDVHIGADCLAHEVNGTVVQQARERRKTVIAFEHGTPELLRAALAQKAVDLDADVKISHPGGMVRAVKVRNISDDGCSVTALGVDAGAEGLEVGDSVLLHIGELDVPGCVVWSMGPDRGIMFELDSSADEQVRAFVATL